MTEFPEKLDSERLLLRCYREEDSSALFDLVDDNRALLICEFAPTATLTSLAGIASFITGKRDSWKAGKTFCYGIWGKSAGELIGQIQVKNVAWEIPAAELGYFIGKRHQRQGFASETIKALLRIALEERGFERVFVRILPSNSGSFALAKKMGFQEEGVQRRAFRCGHGELHDVRCLSLTKEDYRRLAATFETKG